MKNTKGLTREVQHGRCSWSREKGVQSKKTEDLPQEIGTGHTTKEGHATLGTARDTNHEGTVHVPWAWESERHQSLNDHVGGGGRGKAIILFPPAILSQATLG